MDYKNPVQIKVEAEPSFTLAALNKSLFLTDEGLAEQYIKDKKIKTSKTGLVINKITCTSSKEVGEAFGNNSKIFKCIEAFLSQKNYPSKNPIIPDSFTILSIKNTSKISKEDVLTGLNGALESPFYAVGHTLENGIIAPGDLNPWLNEHRKILFEDVTTKTTADNIRSDRYIQIFNKVPEENKAAAYLATVITKGAGSKVDMNILSGCSADVAGGEKQELTSQNINFTEKQTSKDYVVVRTGIATDGTSIDETTAIDCIIYNLIDNILIAMSEKGFKQDDRGYFELETVLKEVMGEMYGLGLIAKEGESPAFKIFPITQTPAERKLKVIRVKILFCLADWSKTVELTLSRTYGKVNE